MSEPDNIDKMPASSRSQHETVFVLRPPAGTLFIHSVAATRCLERRGAQFGKADARARIRRVPPFR
ncbi:hypothetical protein [Burkholderia contaminans]|uniref:hypothetical protein n=1 Tax=Burkholderia contaminans TaxID=488447 RepID=UPI00158A933F|nr:hypothetical protein [Burkholderia contaminans]